jgi:hypothetical protein
VIGNNDGGTASWLTRSPLCRHQEHRQRGDIPGDQNSVG